MWQLTNSVEMCGFGPCSGTTDELAFPIATVTKKPTDALLPWPVHVPSVTTWGALRHYHNVPHTNHLQAWYFSHSMAFSVAKSEENNQRWKKKVKSTSKTEWLFISLRPNIRPSASRGETGLLDNSRRFLYISDSPEVIKHLVQIPPASFLVVLVSDLLGPKSMDQMH